MAHRRGIESGSDDELPQELNFEDEEPAGRIGDPVPLSAVREEFPPRRVREAGHGGSVGGVTADDLAPETLLDDDPSRTPSARQGRDALDTLLTRISEEDAAAPGDEGLPH